MKLTIFGPTGATGQQIVRQALSAGHEVTAVARHPEAVQPTHPQLQAVAGDVLNPASLREPIAGADAVISALGSRKLKQPTTVYSAGTTAILTAMREAGVRRLIAISAAPVAPDQQKNLLERRVLHPMLHRFFGGGYDDMRRMEDLLAASDRDWTVFRPPRLTNKPASGRYRTAVDAPLPRASSIPRADLATAMLAATQDPGLARHAITIAT